MTYQSMQWHERVTLPYNSDDYRRSSLVDLVEPYAAGNRVLDMRSLAGHLSIRLAKKGFDVSALDAYEGAVEMTNALGRSSGFSREIAQLWDLTGLRGRFGRAEFDTVFCLDVLNHVADDRVTLSEISEVLKPGGRIIVSAPALPPLLGKRDRVMGHLRRYSRSGLIELIESNGFKVKSIRYWNFIALPVYVFIEKVLRGQLSDGLRYSRSKYIGSLPNRILSWWYKMVENKVHFPCGLSFVVIAERNQS